MENKDVCRLCLKSEAVAAFPLDEYRITKLKSTIPELNVELEGSACSICVKCKEVLDEFFTLKKTISDNEDLIRSRKAKLNVKDKVKLDQIFSENGSESSEGNICRTCLNSNKDDNLLIDNLSPDDPFQDVLKTCLSNLDRGQITDSVICLKCVKKLFNMYSFVSSCLRVEDKIKQFRESDGVNKNLDIAEVLLKLKEDPEKEEGDNDFLSAFEVQDEEEMDIFDSISYDNIATNSAEVTKPSNSAQWNSDYDTTRKREADTPSEVMPTKRSKYMDEITTSDDVPYFKFGNFLLHTTYNKTRLPAWLAAVDVQKKKHDWSDKLTIHKVLQKLEALPELHPWFSDIGEAMTWDEWSKRLLHSFPDPEDYCVALKHAINRKKKGRETFEQYFLQKTSTLKEMNITGKAALSCIVNGLAYNDVLVCCLARAAKYETHEDLLNFFKQCDANKPGAKQNEKISSSTPEDKSNAGELTKSPKVTKPEVTKSEITKPEVTKSEVTKPEVTKPEVTKPEVTKPEVTKLAPENGQPTKKARSATAKRRRHQTCYKCLQKGHFANQCHSKRVKNLPSNPTQKSQSPTKTGTPQTPANIPKKQEKKPPSTQPAAKKQAQLCTYCGKYGHWASLCPYARQAKARRMQFEFEAEMSLKKALSVIHERKTECSYCHKLGHNADNCFIAKKNVSQLFQNSPANFNRPESCFHCGSGSHLASGCYYSTKQDDDRNGNPVGDYKNRLCFKCYKIGHRSEDCPLYSGRF